MNTGLTASGDFTEYLSLHYSEKFNYYWSSMVNEAKADIITHISRVVTDRCKELEIPDGIIDYIKSDVVAIAVINSYKKYCESVFYDDMLKIYEAGNLPCGWIGRYPDGKFKIY